MDKGLLSTLQKIKLTSHLKRISDDDFVDRINNFYTPLILTILTIVICTKSYIVGEPLQCWVPVHFSGGWEKFSESWCYIKNTYYVPKYKELPTEKDMREHSELQYYQWVPFVLGLQAVLFLFPSIFWKFSNWQGRLHIKPLMQRGVKSSFEVGDSRSTTLKEIAEHIRNSLFKSQYGNHPTLSAGNDKCCGFINSGFYLTFCYLISKLLYLTNIIIQFIIVHRFLKADFFFGFNLLTKLSSGSDWQETGLFPRVTMCDFTTPRIGQDLPTTMQCVLVINLFNEKIYIFLWFWLAFLFLITLINSFIWLIRMLFGRKLSRFVSTKSNYAKNPDHVSNMMSCESEANTDVYLVLRMIDSNCGLMTTRKITEYLISFYKSSPRNDKYNSLSPNYHELDKTDNKSMSSAST
uniref:Innexin n=1 Tax=Dugesia japonica TaxID=6161 RepID=Q2L6M8_DUGJA|nr:innexin7 [Dugesia japonica]